MRPDVLTISDMLDDAVDRIRERFLRDLAGRDDLAQKEMEELARAM